MQSDNFDSKLKQAAEQHYPDYDAKAWTKMEKLLDRHLPQQDSRRRKVILFALLFLLMGGGAWLFITKPWKPADRTLTISSVPGKVDSNPSKAAEQGEATVPPTKDHVIVAPDKTNDPLVKSIGKNDVLVVDPNANGQKKQPVTINDSRNAVKAAKQGNSLRTSNNKAEQVDINIDNAAKGKKESNPLTNNNIVSSPATINNERIVPEEKANTAISKSPDQVPAIDKNSGRPREVKEEQPKTNEQKVVTKQGSKKKRNTFFFSLSAAPDLSSVQFNSPGKLKLLTGAGFGYTFRDRLTLRTGFYRGRKMYTASKEDYKFAAIPPNYPYLDNINADCKVYEIPVSVAYNFGLAKNHHFFAGTGLSSLIMKKEKYVYNYKLANGSTYAYTKTINNEYQHYFSVLTLSAGYEHKISRTFSLSAEPYVKLPMTGVGYGKVKLTSAGIMFSLSMSPFQSSAKK